MKFISSKKLWSLINYPLALQIPQKEKLESIWSHMPCVNIDFSPATLGFLKKNEERICPAFQGGRFIIMLVMNSGNKTHGFWLSQIRSWLLLCVWEISQITLMFLHAGMIPLFIQIEIEVIQSVWIYVKRQFTLKLPLSFLLVLGKILHSLGLMQ